MILRVAALFYVFAAFCAVGVWSSGVKVEVAWDASFNDSVTSVLYASSRVFAASMNGEIRAVGAYNGRSLWTAAMGDQTGDPASFASSLSDVCGLVVATDATHARLCAWDQSTGDPRWSVEISGDVLGDPASVASLKYRISQHPVADTGCVVYVGLDSAEKSVKAITQETCCSSVGAVAAVHARLGEVLWLTNFTTPDAAGALISGGAPVIQGHQVCYSTGPALNGSDPAALASSIVCLNRSDGAVSVVGTFSAEQIVDAAGLTADEKAHYLSDYDSHSHGFGGGVLSVGSLVCGLHDTGAFCCMHPFKNAPVHTCTSPFGVWSDVSALPAKHKTENGAVFVKNGGSGLVDVKAMVGNPAREVWKTSVAGHRLGGYKTAPTRAFLSVDDYESCNLISVDFGTGAVNSIFTTPGVASVDPAVSASMIYWAVYNGTAGNVIAFRGV